MISRLIDKIRTTGAPVCVGLDPMLDYIPEHVRRAAYADFGETLEGAAEAAWRFNKEILDCVHDLVPAVKPQIAMYEQLGVPGMQVFKRTVDYCHKLGLEVIGDIKRGDIGSTSAAYAVAHMGHVQVGGQGYRPFGEDIVTINPYFGIDGIKPFLEVCEAEDTGVFVLVKTSNPSGGEFQNRLVDGRPLYELVAEKVDEWGAAHMDGAYSDVGAVVGATWPEEGAALRKLMPRAYFLVPGYGAQGGTAEGLANLFNEDRLGAIINSSRGIICAYKQETYAHFGAEAFGEAARAAVEDMRADIVQALERR